MTNITKSSKVYLLYKTRISPRYPFEPELVDILSSKEVAEEIAKKKNSYTRLGRTYDYTVKSKVIK